MVVFVLDKWPAPSFSGEKKGAMNLNLRPFIGENFAQALFTKMGLCNK